MTLDIDRRSAILAAIGASAAVAAAGCATAQQQPAPGSSGYQPLPLPFDPKAVPGFSEAILVSHHERNYSGAVRRIGAIQAELASMDLTQAPGFRINGLKREELMAINSMILHEVHFNSMGVSASQPDGTLAAQIEQDFGSEQAWRDEFVSMGKALGGGSGWVLLMWSPRLGRLVNQWAADHSMTIGDGTGLLALDMYEHAYHMDYGANAGAYVDAFMKVLSWEAANSSFARLST